jgi:DNA-binding transcriptional LysR family regulator
MRLDDLDYFLAVAEHGQVRRAALELGVSQPAVTKGLQRLEKELGFPLFERSTRGMAMTPIARHFHERSRFLRASLREAIKEASDLHLGAMGLLRIGVSPLYTQRLFVPAFLRLHAQRPAARVKVTITLNDGLLAALRAGDVDITINALPADLPAEFSARPLIRDDLCVVVNSGHPLLSRRRPRLKDLAGAEWILPGAGVAARRLVEGRLSEAGLGPPRIVLEVDNTVGHLGELLRKSNLVSVMSESMLAGPAGRGLLALPIADARNRPGNPSCPPG